MVRVRESVTGTAAAFRRRPGRPVSVATHASRWAAWLVLVAGGLLAPVAGLADTSDEIEPETQSEVEAEVESEAQPNPPALPPNPDPWESFNRAVFQANEWGDIYAVRPLSQGWTFLTPTPFRSAVTNFNANLQMPVILGNNLLQLKPRNVGDDFLRIVFNLSFGIGGLIDVASAVDIPQNDEDFGQTLGYWGVPAGPYLVLPLYGPSTVRDGVGRLADSAATLYFSFLPFYSTLLVRGVEVINLRAEFGDELDANRAESFDYYVFLRNAYLQNRRAKVAPRRARNREAERDDLYHFEDDLYDVDDDFDDDEDFDDEDFDDDFDDGDAATGDLEPAHDPADDAALRIDAQPRAA